MKATYPQPIINVFTETNVGKYVGTRHFINTNTNGIVEVITPKVRIAVNRSFAKSLPSYWLSFRPANKWVSITGLFYTGIANFYKGDADKKKHLVIVQISDNSERLVLYYFKDYYTRDTETINRIVNKLKSITN